ADWFFSCYLKDERFKTFTGFIAFFTKTFDEHDRKLVSANKIMKIKQGKMDVTSYSTEFQKLSRNLNWNDTALMVHFKKGLDVNIRDHLKQNEKPKKIHKHINNPSVITNRNRYYLNQNASHQPHPVTHDYESIYKSLLSN